MKNLLGFYFFFHNIIIILYADRSHYWNNNLYTHTQIQYDIACVHIIYRDYIIYDPHKKGLWVGLAGEWRVNTSYEHAANTMDIYIYMVTLN